MLCLFVCFSLSPKLGQTKQKPFAILRADPLVIYIPCSANKQCHRLDVQRSTNQQRPRHVARLGSLKGGARRFFKSAPGAPYTPADGSARARRSIEESAPGSIVYYRRASEYIHRVDAQQWERTCRNEFTKVKWN